MKTTTVCSPACQIKKLLSSVFESAQSQVCLLAGLKVVGYLLRFYQLSSSLMWFHYHSVSEFCSLLLWLLCSLSFPPSISPQPAMASCRSPLVLGSAESASLRREQPAWWVTRSNYPFIIYEWSPGITGLSLKKGGAHANPWTVLSFIDELRKQWQVRACSRPVEIAQCVMKSL